MLDMLILKTRSVLPMHGYGMADWGQTPNNQRARYHSITTDGRRQLGEQEVGFADLIAAVRRVMPPA